MYTETFFPRARPLPTAALREAPLFIWYDYFSCPQLEGQSQSLGPAPEVGKRINLARAVDSIPGYIAECKFFIALCPVVESTLLGKVFTPFSWTLRAWCRTERALRELSAESWIIMIKSSTEVEMTASSAPFFIVQPAGDGHFTVEEDRGKLAPIFQKALGRKLRFLLRAQDLVAYRVLLNTQTARLRGFPAVAEYDLIPGFEPDGGGESDTPALAAQQFLYQNGFATVHEVDTGGWSPVHYAALRGDPLVMQGLLQMRANINRWTRKDQPMAGVPLGSTGLGICSLFRNHDTLRLLLSARVKVDSGVHPDVAAAAAANDPEGIRILCGAGGSPFKRNLFGDSAFEYAAAFVALTALEELVIQAGPDLHQVDMCKSLYVATAVRGGSAELVQRLLELRAHVNTVAAPPVPLRLLFAAKTLQHRCGWRSKLTRWAYHHGHQTPLMAAIMSGQYEAAAALIAAGARMDLRNSRNWAAADFAQGQSLPDFLMQLGRPEVPVPLFLVQGISGFRVPLQSKQPKISSLKKGTFTLMWLLGFQGKLLRETGRAAREWRHRRLRMPQSSFSFTSREGFRSV